PARRPHLFPYPTLFRSGGPRASTIAPASKCGMRSAECGIGGRASTPHPALRTPHSIERIEAGNFLSEDQRMHIVRPLVRVHRLRSEEHTSELQSLRHLV